MTYGQHVRSTPQSEPLPGKNQIKNAAGGYVFQVDDWKRLRRFLILGNEGGTYYEGERKLTLENAATVARCLDADAQRTVTLIHEVSTKNLAPKQEPVIFALAMASVHNVASPYVWQWFNEILRIGTHLFTFMQYREDLKGGYGRAFKRALSKWYTAQGHDEVITQALKYQQRNGWSHRDVLRLGHPKAPDDLFKAIFDAIVRPEGGEHKKGISKGWAGLRSFPVVDGYLLLRESPVGIDVPGVIKAHRLQRELIPTELLTKPEVWEALLPNLGYTALIRNLGNLSKCGLLVPMSDAAKFVQKKLADGESLRKSRVHPWQILLAAKTYGQGKGFKGSGTWNVVPQVVEALDGAFHEAFQNVQPHGKNTLLAIDVSGSMILAIENSPIVCAEAAAAMAMVTARVESNYYAMGFATSFKDLGITARDTLTDVLKKTLGQAMGGTDTSVAIRWALVNKIPVEVFQIYTDNEAWAGQQHTCAALEDYRRKMGIQAKLAVIAFTGTNRSIADQADLNSMDFVGLDASLPQALSAFIAE